MQLAGGRGDRAGYDLFSFTVARKAFIEAVDVDLFESHYPALVLEKRPRPGVPARAPPEPLPTPVPAVRRWREHPITGPTVARPSRRCAGADF